jgi:hypothetical protein
MNKLEDRIKRAAALLGQRGGKKKVPKGFARIGKKRLKSIAKAAAEKRWGKRP